MPTLDGSDVDLEPVSPARSSGPKFDTLSGSRGSEKLELDTDAVRKPKPRALPARSSLRAAPEPEPPPPANRWLRVGIGVLCVAVLLIVVVRFAVRPEWILSIAGASSP